MARIKVVYYPSKLKNRAILKQLGFFIKGVSFFALVFFRGRKSD